MWIFSQYGFYSVACARGEKGSIDPDTVMVRARMKQHLQQLQVRFPEIALLPIKCSLTNDYMYRVVMPKKQWVELLSEMAMEQTWSNFKDQSSKFEKLFSLSYSYVDALHEVWEAMNNVQRKENRQFYKKIWKGIVGGKTNVQANQGNAKSVEYHDNKNK
jgi:hypothetical protein